MRYLGFQPASFNFGTPEEIIGFFSPLGYLCHTAVMSETKLWIIRHLERKITHVSIFARMR